MSHTLHRHAFTLQPTVHPLQALAPLSSRGTEARRSREQYHALILNLAHELRQPLSAIFSAMEILRNADAASALANAVEVIGRQTRHLNRLVEDLVESVQGAPGTTLLRTERVDLRSRIAEALSDAAHAAAARKHGIVVSEMPEPLWVDADRSRLRQMLSNLLDNAIKFTEPGGVIYLSASQAGQEVTLRVRDTGCGLRPHELEHIFELFSQVRPGEGRGLGIGLNVVSQVVALHKGRIEVRSDGPSCGSEFIVTLPSAIETASLGLEPARAACTNSPRTVVRSVMLDG